MLNPITASRRFFPWWGQSLLTCLPEKWHGYLSGTRGHFDLIIVHQEDSLVIMTDRGKVLGSITLSDISGIDLDNFPAEDSLIGRISNTQLRAAEKLMPDRDPPMSMNSGDLDLNLTDPTSNSQTDLDIVLGEAPQTELGKGQAPSQFDQTEVSNVFALKIQKDDDATVILEDGDQTTRFLESGNDDDTVVIKNDQGNLLQLETAGPKNKESTILFRSYGGKIQQVDPEDLDSQLSAGTDKAVDIQFDELLANDDVNDYSAVVNLLRAYQGHKKCVYLLPDSRLLNLNLSYPIEAIQNIESVLRYDLEKHIPLDKQEVRYFYALNIDGVREKVNAEVAVIKSEVYDLLNLTLEPFLKSGMLCTTETFYRKYGSGINFLEQKAEENWRSFTRFSSLHFAFNCLLLIALLATPFVAFYQGFDSIEEKSVAEVQRAKVLVADFNSTNAESNFGSLLSERANKAPRAVWILSVLSDSINKQSWLHQFSYKNNEVKIKGEAVSATSVSDDLNSTGIFQSIKFVSSIVKNSRTGKESFELLLTVKPDA